MIPLPSRGLYAVTDTASTREQGLIRCVTAVLEAGAVMVQYRDKLGTQETRRREAEALVHTCHQFGVPLIVNDDAELALTVGADGVHVGRDDWPISRVRRHLGQQAIVGVSCYHDLAAAEEAVSLGADYVAFGRFFASRTKPGQALATPQLLRRAADTLSVPVCAIGGITSANGKQLVAHGADLLAVVHELWAQDDCRRSARALVRCFD